MTIAFLLILAAFILFVIDAFGITARVKLQSIGLACLALSMLVGGATLG